MYNEELRGDIHELFVELHEHIEKMISSSKTYQTAIEEIVHLIAEEVTAESEGYVVDLYMNLVADIWGDMNFQNPDRLYKFYKLDLRNDLYEKYRFDVTSLDLYKKGIEFKEVYQLKSQREFCRAVEDYLFEMENELLDWLEDVTDYFFGQVRTLYVSEDKKIAG